MNLPLADIYRFYTSDPPYLLNCVSCTGDC